MLVLRPDAGDEGAVSVPERVVAHQPEHLPEALALASLGDDDLDRTERVRCAPGEPIGDGPLELVVPTGRQAGIGPVPCQGRRVVGPDDGAITVEEAELELRPVVEQIVPVPVGDRAWSMNSGQTATLWAVIGVRRSGRSAIDATV